MGEEDDRFTTLERRLQGVSALWARDFLKIKADVRALQTHTGCSPVTGDLREATLETSAALIAEATRWSAPAPRPADSFDWREYLDCRFAEVEARLERKLVQAPASHSVPLKSLSDSDWTLDVLPIRPVAEGTSTRAKSDSDWTIDLPSSFSPEKCEAASLGELQATMQSIVLALEKSWVDQLNRINQMAPSLAAEAYDAAVQEISASINPVQQQLDSLTQRYESQSKQMQTVTSKHEELKFEVSVLQSTIRRTVDMSPSGSPKYCDDSISTASTRQTALERQPLRERTPTVCDLSFPADSKSETGLCASESPQSLFSPPKAFNPESGNRSEWHSGLNPGLDPGMLDSARRENIDSNLRRSNESSDRDNGVHLFSFKWQKPDYQ